MRLSRMGRAPPMATCRGGCAGQWGRGMTTLNRLVRWIRALKKRCAARGEEMFMGIPDRWYEEGGAAYRCRNGHVSHMVLKSSEKGDCCLECNEELVMTFPEDDDGPLTSRTSRRMRR